VRQVAGEAEEIHLAFLRADEIKCLFLFQLAPAVFRLFLSLAL
jgi:hypothetical protein